MPCWSDLLHLHQQAPGQGCVLSKTQSPRLLWENLAHCWQQAWPGIQHRPTRLPQWLCKTLIQSTPQKGILVGSTGILSLLLTTLMMQVIPMHDFSLKVSEQACHACYCYSCKTWTGQ